MDLEDEYVDLYLPKYSNIARQIYGSTAHQDSPVYTNEYGLLEFSLGNNEDSPTYILKEYVFVCLSRNSVSGDIMPFYVSKEYNVGSLERFYKPGRFVFTDFVLEQPPTYNYILLAEEPADAYIPPGFNVELYFLQIKQYIIQSSKTWKIHYSKYKHVKGPCRQPPKMQAGVRNGRIILYQFYATSFRKLLGGGPHFQISKRHIEGNVVLSR